MADVRRHLIIDGRVQGVCFRMYTQDTARTHGVRGWVRNLADGRVEAVLEGQEVAVAAVVDWCRSGPPAARVDGVSVTPAEPVGEPEGFRVKPSARHPSVG